MKYNIFGWHFVTFLGKSLQEDGHEVIFNDFNKDSDIIICQSPLFMYPIYRNLKIIKKNNIKLINFVLDIPPWRFGWDYKYNNLKYSIYSKLYDYSHRNMELFNLIENLKPGKDKSKIHNYSSLVAQKLFTTNVRNRVLYLSNYRRFLKKSDLLLSISRFAQKLTKRFLKLDTRVCYVCVDSDMLENIPEQPIKYDAISVGRIVKTKRKEIFVEAANQLGLKIFVVGKHSDKSIKINCPNKYIKDFKEVMEMISASKVYVDPSIYEGFGMTPVEAAFLNRPAIVSNTYVHREVLGDYPVYFKPDDINDLKEKLKIILDGGYSLKNSILHAIKKKYCITAMKEKFLNIVEGEELV